MCGNVVPYKFGAFVLKGESSCSQYSTCFDRKTAQCFSLQDQDETEKQECGVLQEDYLQTEGRSSRSSHGSEGEEEEDEGHEKAAPLSISK